MSLFKSKKNRTLYKEKLINDISDACTIEEVCKINFIFDIHKSGFSIL